MRTNGCWRETETNTWSRTNPRRRWQGNKGAAPRFGVGRPQEMTDTPPVRRRGPSLPNVLALLTYDDGPYDPEGDGWRLTFAVLTALVFAAILDREPLSPAARTVLLVLFGPELFRRMWVTLPAA